MILTKILTFPQVFLVICISIFLKQYLLHYPSKHVFVKSLTVASSPTSTTLPTSPTSLGKCFIKNCTPVVISFPPQAPAIQCLVQLAQCNCNRRTGRLHQILSPHCLCRLENCSRLSDKYIHQTSQQYETQQLGDCHGLSTSEKRQRRTPPPPHAISQFSC